MAFRQIFLGSQLQKPSELLGKEESTVPFPGAVSNPLDSTCSAISLLDSYLLLYEQMWETEIIVVPGTRM